MTDDDFQIWAAHHGTLFLMTSEQDEALFRAWKPLVLPYELADFIAGSNYLAREKSSAFRTTHLDQIRQRINAAHIEATRLRLEAEAAFLGQEDTCQDCFGPGIASVPHLSCVRDMEWFPPYTTFGIFCHCPVGRAKYSSFRENNRSIVPMEFAKYEALVPNFRELLTWREQLRAAEIKARSVARHADLAMPLRRILERTPTLLETPR